MTVKSHQF